VGVLHPRQSVSESGKLFQGHRVPHGAPGGGKEGGRPGGGGQGEREPRHHVLFVGGLCEKDIEYHGQHLAIAKEVGDRAGEGSAYANLGNADQSQGDYAKAIGYHKQHLAIAKEVGDRAGEGGAYGNISTCHMHLKEYVKAVVAYFDAQHALATSLKLAHVQSEAAMINMGVALTLHVRAGRKSPATGADQGPGPHSILVGIGVSE
jgi:hypothetical protein